jgi:hypothetical protein
MAASGLVTAASASDHYSYGHFSDNVGMGEAARTVIGRYLNWLVPQGLIAGTTHDELAWAVADLVGAAHLQGYADHLNTVNLLFKQNRISARDRVTKSSVASYIKFLTLMAQQPSEIEEYPEQVAEELAWVQNDNRTDRHLAQYQSWWQINEPVPMPDNH